MKNFIEKFQETKFRVVSQEGRKFMSVVDIAKFLDYKNEYVQANVFLSRNKELLEEEVITVITTSKQGKQIKQTFLSLEGVLMFLVKTNQKKAIPFQKWAKKVLAKEMLNMQTPKYKQARLKSKEIRNSFTDTLSEHGISKPHEYMQLTYTTKVDVGIDKDKKKDDMSILELIKISMAESLSTYKMIEKDPEGYYEVKPIVSNSSKTIRKVTKKQLS
jgi:prophage antirepressor-like protein